MKCDEEKNAVQTSSKLATNTSSEATVETREETKPGQRRPATNKVKCLALIERIIALTQGVALL